MNIVIERACENDALKLIETRNKSFYDDFIIWGSVQVITSLLIQWYNELKMLLYSKFT